MLPELVALIAPPRCALCGEGCSARTHLCERCELRLCDLHACQATVPGLACVWSAARYTGAARDLVLALKFGGRVALAQRAAAAIAARAPSGLLRGAIVPVPPAPWRRRWRGFDPAEAIAAALSTHTGLEVRRCLRRSQGRRQVGRPRAKRLAFPPRVRASGPSPAAAILVDDVVTTGATIGACARALRSAGCGRVVALTFTRS